MVHELTSEARETLKVLALAFCKEGVEREGAFSASTYAGKHRQFSVRDIKIDVLEVVRFCAADLDARAILSVHVDLAVDLAVESQVL